MIKLEYTGMCKDCTCSELELECYVEEVCNKKYWSVKCIHVDACSTMEDKMIERLKIGGKDNGRHD